MGKKSSIKDRAYLTATEWREEWGGKKRGSSAPFSRLPFDRCAISFLPFEDAVCSPDGTVMDVASAVPFVKRYGRDPCTGHPLAVRDLVPLKWHRDADGRLSCPVLCKPFTNDSAIVALRTTGHVFSREAIDELCLGPKNLRDPLDDSPFKRGDVVVLQDPKDLRARQVDSFEHVKMHLDAPPRDDARDGAPPGDGVSAVVVAPSGDAARALAKLDSAEARAALEAGGGGRKAQAERLEAARREREKGREEAGAAAAAAGSDATAACRPASSAGRRVPPPYSTRVVSSHASTGAAARAFTATTLEPVRETQLETRVEQLWPTKKAYARIITNLGPLNVELHADLVPKTVENFLALAESGYYDGTIFHRSVRNFVLQGGDPTGTGKGGDCVFGPGGFEDEISPSLRHQGRGVLSMANKGPNTNTSQFFITYRSAPSLDGKHSVFGRVVGGLETLSAAERIPVDSRERPRKPIEIESVEIFVNPFREILEKRERAQKREQDRADAARERARAAAAAERAGRPEAAATRPEGGAKADDGAAAGAAPASAARPAAPALPDGIGKYLPKALLESLEEDDPASAGSSSSRIGAAAASAPAPAAAATSAPPPAKRARPARYGNFDAW